MTKHKRTAGQREGDLERLASLYLRRMRQVDIAKELGVAQSQISYDLKVLQKRWRDSASINFNEAMSRELAGIEEMERHYWAEWEQSKHERVRSRSRRKEHAVGEVSVVENQADMERETRLGDPRYLEGVQWCVETRIKIYSLLAPGPADAPKPPGAEGEVEGAWRVLTVVKDYGPPEETDDHDIG